MSHQIPNVDSHAIPPILDTHRNPGSHELRQSAEAAIESEEPPGRVRSWLRQNEERLGIFLLLRSAIQPLSRIQSSDPSLTEPPRMCPQLLQPTKRTAKPIPADTHGCFPRLRIDPQA